MPYTCIYSFRVIDKQVIADIVRVTPDKVADILGTAGIPVRTGSQGPESFKPRIIAVRLPSVYLEYYFSSVRDIDCIAGPVRHLFNCPQAVVLAVDYLSGVVGGTLPVLHIEVYSRTKSKNSIIREINIIIINLLQFILLKKI